MTKSDNLPKGTVLPWKTKRLWWQERNLMYTSTGYGSKIPTSKMVRYNNRWYRLYCCIYSNSGLLYIVIKGIVTYVDDYNLGEEVTK